MKGPLGSGSKLGFPLGVCTILLVECVVVASGAGAVSTPIDESPVVTRTTEIPHTTKASRQRAGRAGASLSVASRRDAKRPSTAPGSSYEDHEIAALKARLDRQEEQLAVQQRQIARLVAAFEERKKLPSLQVASATVQAPNLSEAVSFQPALPMVAAGSATASPTRVPLTAAQTTPPLQLASLSAALPKGYASDPSAVGSQPAALPLPRLSQAALEQTQPYTSRLDVLERRVEGISKGIAGFRFSGDLRIRGDGILRTSNPVASSEQNVRGRYRARLNFDKAINQQLDVHFQVGSGRFDNPLTDDTDFGGGAVRGPIFLTEAWVHYHPDSSLSLRAGKMPEVFQDYSRFLWDEDVRFNGFQESVGTSPESGLLGVTRIDFRAGQYILTNPNIQVLPSAATCASTPQTITQLPAVIKPSASVPAACAYLQAGYHPGENVRAADLFDQGVFATGRIKPGWSQYFFADVPVFRNPNQLALGSTSGGLPLLVNNLAGVTLAGPLPGTGSATTMPGGGIYTAGHFQIGHLAYRLTKEGWTVHGEEFPVFVDLHASRNFGTSFLRNAWMATLNAGQIRKAGDVRFLYSYSVKDANSMVSQFTDDHIGTLSGVNIRTHSIRFDLGLAPFLQWQNIFYIQNEISRNDPARHFYVPVQAGTPTQYRMESSLFVNF